MRDTVFFQSQNVILTSLKMLYIFCLGKKNQSLLKIVLYIRNVLKCIFVYVNHNLRERKPQPFLSDFQIKMFIIEHGAENRSVIMWISKEFSTVRAVDKKKSHV